MIFVLFLLLALLLYCPCFTLLSSFGRVSGFSVFTLRHHEQCWRVIHLSVRERVGRMNRRRVRFYHQAFVRALNEALQTGEPVVFRSHLMRPSQIRLACQILVPTRRRYHIVTVVIPSYERRLMMLLILLQEWRLIRVPSQGVMVVVSSERRRDIS
ncbi:hypothetical protein CN851_15780 [Salmonella enterica]|uniref:Pili assembly chaperone n=3 Tax=Enterobacteriaceae TaxID=543 RepID=A0A5V2R3N7_SALER|nr:hypothetical protein [Salmonella enterica]EBX4722582.1 hypothetical protein [Salmonella enterica subsp. enterica serovar Rubislaw]EBY0804326.1 hypothetical protein [Salmonella enterica subsp. enterica serovar Berlin]ECW7869861.1 hypothetical protein [Salmonella enterica subsp. enterica serovar Kingabwa]HCM3591971.1 hypothetical protein [Salmonella enterica subsp. enterica serovar Stanley]HEB7431432.1 hypothetical protein [Salmonella enterica subsp. enterica serovar Hvittingfoss]